MSKIVDNVMTDYHGRRMLMEKVRELKDKRALLNYLQTQFGSTNPLANLKLTSTADLDKYQADLG